MKISEALEQVLAFRNQAHVGYAQPIAAYVGIGTADQLSGGPSATLFGPRNGFEFGRDALSVTHWYVDPRMTDGEIRFELVPPAPQEGAEA